MEKKEVLDINKFNEKEKKVWALVFHFPYKKLLLLAILTLFSYSIFRNPDVQNFLSSLGGLEYLGGFLAGILFTFGFTTPIAVGFFIVLNPTNPFLVAIIGGLGALIGDLLIFSFIKVNFIDEFERLKETRIMLKIRRRLRKHLSYKVREYLLYLVAGIIIASPLPDEIGVMMLAGLTSIDKRILAITSFVCNSIGIFIICFI